MQTQKMSLANIKGKLSRDEMKKIMAGSGTINYCGSYGRVTGCPSGTTPEKCGNTPGEAICKETSTGTCYSYGTATCHAS